MTAGSDEAGPEAPGGTQAGEAGQEAPGGTPAGESGREAPGGTQAGEAGQEDTEDRQTRAGARAPEDRSTCTACRGTGRVKSSLGGEPHEVICPWCGGSGRFQAGRDAQAEPSEQPHGTADTA